MTPDEIELMKRGYILSAIKAVQARTGVLPKEAKALVESTGDRFGLRKINQNRYRSWHEFR